MNRPLLISALSALLFLGLILVQNNPSAQAASSSSSSSAVKFGGEGYQCEGAEPQRWKTENTSAANLGSTYTIATVTVKAGDSCIDVYPVNTAPTCYSAVVSGSSVAVTKIGSGNTCQGISHLEGTYSSVTTTPTDTPTPTYTPTPTNTPTPTHTPTPTLTVTNTPTPTPTSICHAQTSCNTGSTITPTPTTGVTDTPTPTPSASASATPTPATTPGSSTPSTQGASTTSSAPQVQPAQAVLGATTMAPTGSFLPSLMNSLLSLGVLSLSIGSTLYAKTKKN